MSNTVIQQTERKTLPVKVWEEEIILTAIMFDVLRNAHPMNIKPHLQKNILFITL